MAVNLSGEEGALDAGVDRELRLALMQRAPDGTADETLATCSFSHGLFDLGVAFTLRSAGAFRSQGNAVAAARVFAAAGAHIADVTPTALASLARGRARAGQLGPAAELLVAAAERSRRDGRVEEAAEFCLAAARWQPQLRDVHRTWSLALLAAGDPDGALGHLACWGKEDDGAWDRMRAELEDACGARRASELIVRARRVAETTAPGGNGASQAVEQRSRAFLAPGLAARREQLVRVLGEADIDVVEASCEGGVAEALVRALPLDLLILPIGPDRCPREEWLHDLQTQPGLEGLPILGALAGELDVDRLETLRRLGLSGVLDLGAAAEHIMFRVKRILRRAGPERRVHTRIPVTFDVTMDVDGVVTTERADSLSSGGLRLRCTRLLEINQHLRLRFRPEPEMGSIRANARVVNCLPPAAGEPGHAIGVFFLDLASTDRARLDALVARRLAGESNPEAPGADEPHANGVRHLRYPAKVMLPENR